MHKYEESQISCKYITIKFRCFTIIQLKSFWRDQKCEPFNVFVARMRIVMMKFSRMNITSSLLIW